MVWALSGDETPITTPKKAFNPEVDAPLNPAEAVPNFTGPRKQYSGLAELAVHELPKDGRTKVVQYALPPAVELLK